ncbi:hypothetical protein F5B20DRAFT_575338 [Whalleya microplaca]|nr:hypothetical protein F5B20DRAFT_575338 [Whalleya microplaca]
MAPSSETLRNIVSQAERDLNSYQAKTGAHKTSPNDEAGVDSRVENKQTRGEHFEGAGGPEQKLAQQARDYGGNNEFDPTGKRQREVGSRDATESTVPYGRDGRDVLPQGKEAVQSNIEGTKYAPRKDQFKGSDYYTPESVPGSISAEGYEPPESVTQSSREAERYY